MLFSEILMTLVPGFFSGMLAAANSVRAGGNLKSSEHLWKDYPSQIELINALR